MTQEKQQNVPCRGAGDSLPLLVLLMTLSFVLRLIQDPWSVDRPI